MPSGIKGFPTLMTSFKLNGDIIITEQQLNHWNEQLAEKTPKEILEWAVITFPNLFQTTAFGLSGLVTIDLLYSLGAKVPLIFVDTLYHFPQTLDLLQKIKEKYYKENQVYIYKPRDTSDEKEFVEKYGDNLWETDDDKYDYLVKVEPAQRAYKELGVTAVFTGRRRSQGGARSELQIVEVAGDIIKINPMANWDFATVKRYIDEHSVPYNELLDHGYKSIGDWHSTQPVADGQDERSGRWAGKTKTECGIHETSRFAQFLQQQ